MARTRARTAVLGTSLVALALGTIDARGLVAHQQPGKPETRTQPTDATSTSLLKEGLRRSATLRELAADIEASDVLVLVGVSHQPGMWRGVTSFVAAGDGVRILRVTLNARLLADEQLAVLGHELQHAREVAASRVVDQAGMERLFEKLGHQRGPRRGYETDAAQLIERRVRHEVASNR